MRLALTICSILIGSFIASAQPNSKLTLETELFSIEFPDLPEFDHDTLDSKDTLISYSHTVDHDSITYSIVHRNRTEVDNKTETFDAEIDWLGYWTLADISDKTKSKLNGFQHCDLQRQLRLKLFTFITCLLTRTSFALERV